MALPEPHPFFTVTAKDPKDAALAEMANKLFEHMQAKDEFRDMCGIPRVGREPDYLYGRWCIRCHNSLPLDWKDPCDVCGSQTVWQGGQAFAGLLAEGEESSAVTTYSGVQRGGK